MKLYYSPGACSLASHIVALEAGQKITPVRASTKTHALDDGTDFYTINPLGYVPVLELDDGRRLTEGPAIMQYLADQAPQTKLAPASGTWERYQLQAWLNFIATELHKNFGPLWNPSTPAEVRDAARERLRGRYGYVDEQLGSRPMLTGETFTVADAYLFVMNGWARHHDLDLSPFPNVTAFQKRVSERAAVRQAMKEEGLA